MPQSILASNFFLTKQSAPYNKEGITIVFSKCPLTEIELVIELSSLSPPCPTSVTPGCHI